MPFPCHSYQGHGTARPSGEGLWATCPPSDSSDYQRSSSKVVIRSIPILDAGGQCETKQGSSWTRKRVVAAHYEKDDLLNCWTSSSDISGYHTDFHEGQGTIGAWQGHGLAAERHGRGTACNVWIGIYWFAWGSFLSRSSYGAEVRPQPESTDTQCNNVIHIKKRDSVWPCTVMNLTLITAAEISPNHNFFLHIHSDWLDKNLKFAETVSAYLRRRDS